jgi:hypothetical protein
MKHRGAWRARRILQHAKNRDAILYFLRAAGSEGLSLERLQALLYMADVLARECFGRPITSYKWRRA